jgi:HSP20 family protein
MPALPVPSQDVQRSLAQLRDRLQDALERWRHALQRETRRSEAQLTRSARAVSPMFFSSTALEIDETDDDVIVRAELPGLRPEEIKVEATPDRLIISAERSETREERDGGLHRLERRYGSVTRSVALPCEVIPEKARARFRDGVLRVTLPKSERGKARRVRVRVA